MQEEPFIEYEGFYEGESRFNDIVHIYNFLNYLLRTDKNQKWTNDLSRKNILFLLDRTLTLRTEEEKQYAKRLALDTLKPHIQKNYKKLSNDLVYFNCFIEDKAIDIRLIDREQIVGLCHNLIYDLKESTKKKYLFSVLHLDQTDSEAHIHSIIIN